MADQPSPPAGRRQSGVGSELAHHRTLPVAGEATAEGSPRRLAGDRPESPERVLLTSKLKPGLRAGRRLRPRLHGLLAPRPGSLVLVHAAAGYGKTTALAATQKTGWLWYNLDRGDRHPLLLARRLRTALAPECPDPDVAEQGEGTALELAHCLHGRSLTITFDRYEQLGDAPEV